MLLGKSAVKFRINPRRSWYWNLERVTADGDHEVTFHLKQPQPALIALLASGYSPVYPCHVPPQEMRQHPIGTGPFKFVAYKPGESIRLTRNPDYWKPGRPYLDGIEWTIIPNRSTALLAFVAGKLDMTFPYEVTVPLLKDIERQDPQAICELAAERRQQYIDRQPQRTAFRQSRSASGDGADLGPPSLHRRAERRPGRHRRRNAASAGGIVGHAAGAPQDIAGV